jgi:hypothetical protein
MIKAKNKVCIECNRDDQPWFSKKRCRGCAIIQNAKSSMTVVRKAIKKQTDKNKEYRKSQSAIRDPYFEYHIANCTSSEHSGGNIFFPTRANCCHLFDKARHQSVQGNLINCVYLTLDEHTRFDQLLYSHQFDKLSKEFPNAWAHAVNRMKLLLPEVKEETKFKHRFEEWIQSKQSEID